VFALRLWDPNALEASAPIEEFLNYLRSGEQQLTAALRESVVLIHPWVSEPRASPPLGPDGMPALPHELDDHLLPPTAGSSSVLI
jgi:hypothetical protein